MVGHLEGRRLTPPSLYKLNPLFSILLCFFVGFLLAILLIARDYSQKMGTPAVLVKTFIVPKKPSTPELGELILLWNSGQYDALIEKATLALAKHEADKRITYFRGYAYRRIGWLDAAYRDFHSLGDFSVWPRYPNATKLAADMKALMALRPPIKHVVRVKGKIAFRVYTTADTPFSANVIASLPKGYLVASNFLGKELEEIPVFIFTQDKYDQFLKFYNRAGVVAPQKTPIFENNGTITISQRNGNNSVMAADEVMLPRIITHEMTHVIMERQVGKIKDFPHWFEEGSADMLASSLAPTQFWQNDRKMQKLLKQSAILPLNQITSRTTFYKNSDRNSEGTSQSEPYAQGHNMTRYLGSLLKDPRFSNFLVTIRQKHSFEAAVKETTGLTTPQFYDSWRKAIQTLN